MVLHFSFFLLHTFPFNWIWPFWARTWSRSGNLVSCQHSNSAVAEEIAIAIWGVVLLTMCIVLAWWLCFGSLQFLIFHLESSWTFQILYWPHKKSFPVKENLSQCSADKRLLSKRLATASLSKSIQCSGWVLRSLPICKAVALLELDCHLFSGHWVFIEFKYLINCICFY